MTGSRRGSRKDIRLFVSLLVVSSLFPLFGCAPRTINLHDSGQGPQVRDDLVRYAVTLLGKPYRNAAKGPDAFDCSGFVHHIYKRFDITLPVSTAGLNRVGYEIPRSDVLAGDLIVFRINGAHHVGIMINNLEFIHASKTRGIAIDSVDAGYWKRNFSHFSRVL